MNTKKALLAATITRWEEILQDPGIVDTVLWDSPLCKKYFDSKPLCAKCPVKEHTGYAWCAKTPFRAAFQQIELFQDHNEAFNPDPVQKEIEFLFFLYHKQLLDFPEISQYEELVEAYSKKRKLKVIDEAPEQYLFLRSDQEGPKEIVRASGFDAAQEKGFHVELLFLDVMEKHGIWLDVQPLEKSK